MTDLDSRLTFDTFVVGPANRLAAAAARRAAESPGASYNPLFLYSASGLGKSHILTAVAHQAQKVHSGLRGVYQTLEGYLAELARALQEGEQEDLREQYQSLDLLLLDDVQFLTDQPQAQEMLLRTLDAMSAAGKQIVLASDRPPAEINGLDARLLSRFSAGLIVDIGPPEFETRVAIVRKKLESRDTELPAEISEAIARYPFRNVRELQGGLNRILAMQDLEGRPVDLEDVPGILGSVGAGENGGSAPQRSSLAVRPTQAEEPRWRRMIREAVEDAEDRGFSASKLSRILEAGQPPEDPDAVVREFGAALDRLAQVRKALDSVGNPWPEAALAVLKDPERLDEAEALLASAQELVRPFPPLPEGPDLTGLPGSYPSLVVKASHRLAHSERPDYNPLFLSCPGESRARRILAAAGRSFLKSRPEGRVALVSATQFAEDFIRALSAGVAGAWRERWWSVELLLLYGTEALSETERAQDEFFHLFEALQRREARMFMAADRPPSGIVNIDDRLRSRFEGGLVVEMDAAPPNVEAAEAALEALVPEEELEFSPFESAEGLATDGAGDRKEPGGDEAGSPPGEDVLEIQRASTDGVVPEGLDVPSAADLVPVPDGSPRLVDRSGSDEVWRPSREKVIWDWPQLEERLVEVED